MHDSHDYMSECIGYLVSSGYVRPASSGQLPEERGCAAEDSLTLTSKGRTYRSELRRDRVSRYGPALLAGVLAIAGTLLGVILGWHIGRG